MIRVPLQVLMFSAALAASGAASADIYTYIQNGRTSIVFSDTPPADGRYKLYKKDRVDQVQVGSRRQQAAVQGPVRIYGRLTRDRYSSQVMAAAQETAVDPALIHAVISVESGYNPSARSHAGAVGLMQLMPQTAKRYGVTDRLDPAQNIRGGARYLRDLKVMFNNQLHLVIAAYNAGEEAVFKYGKRIPPYRETIAYVPKVMGHYKLLQYRSDVPIQTQVASYSPAVGRLN
jgi:soluble lytic murein transglycosylase-like protein